jgi:hypothetical protein
MSSVKQGADVRGEILKRKEFVMAVRELDDPPVTLIGRARSLAEPIAAALRHRGFEVAHGRLAQPNSRWHEAHLLSTLSIGVSATSVGTVMLILDADLTESLFAGRISCASRRRLRACANDTYESAVRTVHARGAGRVLLICDERQLSFGQQMRATRWIRNLAHRIEYENSINGSDEVVTSYAAVGTDHDVRRIADAVLKWDGDDESRRAERGVLCRSPAARSSAVRGPSSRRPDSNCKGAGEETGGSVVGTLCNTSSGAPGKATSPITTPSTKAA